MYMYIYIYIYTHTRIYICITESLCCTPETTRHCKSTILQLKIQGPCVLFFVLLTLFFLRLDLNIILKKYLFSYFSM